MKHNICMVSDFFYPNIGGVESHIYQLSQCLCERGHKVIVITHAYGDRTGVRYLANGLKIYYLPSKAVYNQNVLPTVYSSLAVIRFILLREQITVVHGHSAFSTLAHEAMLHARIMGKKVVYTDHSLFGFADASSIVTNKVLKFSLAGVNHAICVSHTSKENTVLRAAIDPAIVSVIPNAVDASAFTPDSSQRYSDKINVVVMSRLVYRKGADFLCVIIPEICARHTNVNFIIGGDGPKRIIIEEVREQYQLQERVFMLGTVDHSNVRDVLVKGHIFLNTSLTEAFCIAIVEAACCGLQVVSTNVGGVPEVLPPHLIHLAEPCAKSLIEALDAVIRKYESGNSVNVFDVHDNVKHLYTWQDVAKRTEHVYNTLGDNEDVSFMTQLGRYNHCGRFAGKMFMIIALINYILCVMIKWLVPKKNIDIAPVYFKNAAT